MIDMETMADRIKAERFAAKLNQLDLAVAANVSKQAISAIENGKTLDPEHDTLMGICRRLNLNPSWLKSGKGPKHPQPQAPNVGSDRAPVSIATNEIPPGYVRLQILNMEGDMGHGSYNDQPPEVVQLLDVAEWWARSNLPPNLDRVKVISSRGDSMAGVINHGDVVFVDSGITHYDGEGIYVFNWQGRALIKRLAPNLRTGQLQILSANSAAYPPEDVPPGEIDQLHIAGRVVAWWTLRKH